MVDRQSHTFNILLRSRERQAKKLDTLLAEQRNQLQELAAQEQAKHDEIAKQMEELTQRETHLKQMMSEKAAVNLIALNSERQYRDVIIERRMRLEAELPGLQQATLRKEEEIRQIQREIAKNQAQIEAYQKRLKKLQQSAFKAAEESRDEEAAEALVAQRRLKEKSQKEREKFSHG